MVISCVQTYLSFQLANDYDNFFITKIAYFLGRNKFDIENPLIATYSLFYFAGAIFSEDQKHSHIELAFKYAVQKINRDRVILPKTTLVYDIQYVPKEDSFHATKKGKTHKITISQRETAVKIFHTIKKKQCFVSISSYAC